MKGAVIPSGKMFGRYTNAAAGSRVAVIAAAIVCLLTSDGAEDR